LVGGKEIKAQDAAGNTAAPQLAQALGKRFLGGDVGGASLLAVIAAVAFATILAVVAGLTLASSSSVSHDFYANVVKRGQATERQEINVARVSALVIGALSIVLAIFAQKLNVAFLVALAFAVAASGNLPAILYSLFWKRFTTVGATAAIYGGLISAVGLVAFSPVVSSTPTSWFPHADFAWFPLSNPGIISIPIGFLCGWIGTLLSSEPSSVEKYAELEVRSISGAGAH
ncbi:MAG: cation acetate symporter, partial [Catenulispora sp.]|nr:cation acetate symporter [Catenulispora sp.]